MFFLVVPGFVVSNVPKNLENFSEIDNCEDGKMVWIDGYLRNAAGYFAAEECSDGYFTCGKNFPEYFRISKESESLFIKTTENLDVTLEPENLKLGDKIMIKGVCVTQGERKLIVARQITNKEEIKNLGNNYWAHPMPWIGISLIILASAVYFYEEPIRPHEKKIIDDGGDTDDE